jgi:hypothetical protein
LILSQGCGGSVSYNEWFFADSSNFTTWGNIRRSGYERHYTKSITLRPDSTFTIVDYVEGYGDVQLTGKYSASGIYDIRKNDITLYKDLELEYRTPEKGKYARLMLKWDAESSYHVTGNAVLGMSYKLTRPGYCGSRNYRNYYDYILLDESDDGKKVENLGVIHMSCQEGTGKTYKYVEWFGR